MTAVQLDLFAADPIPATSRFTAPATRGDVRRLVGGLTCLRDAVPEAMYVLIHLDYWLPRDERRVGASGTWAYSIRRDSFHYEDADDWWNGARARGERWGWERTPAHHITWAELAEQLGDDPRRADLITWSESLVEPAWQERHRPHELWPDPDTWNPDYITGDHAHPGWERRIAAWRTLQTILTDAVSRLSDLQGAAA